MAHFDKEICLVVLALVCGKVGVSAQKYPYSASPATVGSSAQRYADDGISSSAGGGGGYLFPPSGVPAEKSQRLFRNLGWETGKRPRGPPERNLTLPDLRSFWGGLFPSSLIVSPRLESATPTVHGQSPTFSRRSLELQPVNTQSLEIPMVHSRKGVLASCVAHPKALLHMPLL